MSASKWTILRNKIFLYVCIFFLLYPKVIDYQTNIISRVFHFFYGYIPYFILPILIVYLWNCNKYAQRLYLSALAFQFMFLVANIYNQASRSAILIWYKNTAWILFTLVFLCSALLYYSERTLIVIRKFCNILSITNLIVMIIFPEGIAKIEMINTEWNVTTWTDSVGLIDVDNRISLFLLLTFFVNALWQFYKYKKIKYWRYFFIPILTIILAWSGTGVLGVFWATLFLLFSRKKYISKLVNRYWIFLVYAIVFVMFVVFQRFEMFKFIIVDILHKNMSISNRTTIWSYYIALIAKNIILGYGTTNEGGLMNWNGTVWYAHNQILDIFVQGGVLAFVAFCIMVMISKKHIDKSNTETIKGIFNTMLFAYLIIGIAEHFLVLFNMCFFVFLGIGYMMKSLFYNNSKGENICL